MKSLVALYEDLLHDCSRRCEAPVARDVKTLRQRVEHEGISFLTITLPAFARDFERSLEAGQVTSSVFVGWKAAANATYPAFLQGFVRQVFDAEGHLLPNPSIDCVRCVRQICLFAKKAKLECTSARNEAAIEGYRKCEEDITPLGVTQLARYFRLVAHILVGELGLEDAAIAVRSLGRHGPGATREGLTSNQRWNFPTWYRKLTNAGLDRLTFGLGRLVRNLSDLVVTDWSHVEPGKEQPVKVTLVPKTLKTPRVIAVEPSCMQFAQQALMAVLVRQIDTCRLTGRRINFADQSINQNLALSSSLDGNYATLDMSEASDRVSLEHVRVLLASAPRFRALVEAARSERAELPTGDLIDLKKFASMGSALCFPIEALVFFTSIIASRLSRAGAFPSLDTVQRYAEGVYVYGDDLIVPADEASVVCDDLEALGFKVNRNKSFWSGKFRESCGVDAFLGEQVTPVYLREVPKADEVTASVLLSLVSTGNQLYRAGYHRTASRIQRYVEGQLGLLPSVPEDSPAIGWHGHSEHVPHRRWNKALQRWETRVWISESIARNDPLDGVGALAKCLRTVASKKEVEQTSLTEPVTDQRHLVESTRPYGLALKRRWVYLP